MPLLICHVHSGFASIDCGGAERYTDEIGLVWVPDHDQIAFGQRAIISVPGERRKQYSTVRYFPPDNKKYCYALNVTARTRYLVRATFLYGNFDNGDVYPKFDISLGPTHWWTVVISNANTVEMSELIFLAQTPTISVCLSNATTGQPFISTLELRPFNDSLYLSEFEMNYHLFVSTRINFGAQSDEPIRSALNSHNVTFFYNDAWQKLGFSSLLRCLRLMDMSVLLACFTNN